MAQKIIKGNLAPAAELVPMPSFGDGDWHLLHDLLKYEARLLSVRQNNKHFSDAVRLDTSPDEKLRRDELIPFLDLAKHDQLPSSTLFRKPAVDLGVDLEFNLDGTTTPLQITTAYPASYDRAGKPLNGGHQYRLHMEKLTAKGILLGRGPFERRGDEILHQEEGCTTWDQIESSCIVGLIHAFTLKKLRGLEGVTLLVKARGYYQDVFEAERFRSIVDTAATEGLPQKFLKVIVVDAGPGFIWSSSPAEYPAQHTSY